MRGQLLALATLVSALVLPVSQSEQPLLSPIPDYLRVLGGREEILAEHSLDLTSRDEDSYVNEIFVYNIFLALEYLGEEEFTLAPGEVFAFHDNVLPEFAEPKITMNSEFFVEEGYKSIGGLGGNGVCHLASLMNWVASEARLAVVAKANHGFALIPGVPKEYGTSIRSQSQNQNLYLRNNLNYPVKFVFTIEDSLMTLRVFFEPGSGIEPETSNLPSSRSAN